MDTRVHAIAEARDERDALVASSQRMTDARAERKAKVLPAKIGTGSRTYPFPVAGCVAAVR